MSLSCSSTTARWGVAIAAALPMVARGQEEVTIEAAPPARPAEVLDASTVAVAVDAADLLDSAAGVAIRRLGGPGAFAGVSIRGSTFRQVQVHLDGVPLNPDGSDAADLSELPAALLSEVRLWRSFAPPAYGAAPMGGVIDVRLAAPSGRTHGAAGLRWGSPGFWELSGVAAGAGPRAGVLAAVDALGSGGRFRYHDDQGTRFVADDDRFERREHNGTAQLTGLLRWEARTPWGRLTLLDAWLLRDEDQAGPIGAPAHHARVHTARNVLGLSWLGGAGRVSWSGRLWGLVRGERLDDPAAEVGIGAPWQRDAVAHLGAAAGVQVEVHPTTRLNLDLAARGERAVRSTSTEQASLSSRQVVTIAPSAAIRLFAQRLTLEPVVDLRLFSSPGELRAELLPRFAVSARPTDSISMSVVAARGFRPPDLSELAGARAGWRGNPDLQPESSWLGEATLGLRGQRGPWSGTLDATGFVQAARDRIVWIQNAQRSLVPVNLESTRAGGLELTGRGSWSGLVEARVAWSWQDVRDLRSGHPVPLVPATQLDLTLSARPHTLTRVAVTLEHVDGVWQDSAGLLRLPGRLTLDTSFDITLGQTGLTLNLAARNLTDRVVAEVPADPLYPDGARTRQAVTDIAGWPLPGRTFFASIRWSPPELP